MKFARCLTALFLAYIKERVEKMAGCAMNEAVMAIPVDFSSEQRADLREAAHRAGICIKSFVSEPTAAYVKCRDELAGASNVAVFDWGGGTLDISLISIENREVSELAVAGMRLAAMILTRCLHAISMRKLCGRYRRHVLLMTYPRKNATAFLTVQRQQKNACPPMNLRL